MFQLVFHIYNLRCNRIGNDHEINKQTKKEILKIARYVRDFANILRFLRFTTSLALLKLRNFYIMLLLITNDPTVENGPYLKYILNLVSLHCSLRYDSKHGGI